MSYHRMTAAVVQQLRKLRVVPVLALNNTDVALRVCELLLENGLPAAEISFTTAVAAQTVLQAARRFPELYLGAGTVLNIRDLRLARDAGARFASAPGFNPTVVRSAVENHYPFIPGVAAPSELEQAYELGCTLFKFFPTESTGGPDRLKSLIALYRHLDASFIPTGIDAVADAAGYLALPQVAAINWIRLDDEIVSSDNWRDVSTAIAVAIRMRGEHR